jgi:hypothetical protein
LPSAAQQASRRSARTVRRMRRTTDPTTASSVARRRALVTRGSALGCARAHQSRPERDSHSTRGTMTRHTTQPPGRRDA